MTADFEDGTTLLFSWDPPPDNDSYISLRNSKWRSIVEAKDYTLEIEIDEWSTIDEGHGRTGDGLDPGVSLFLDDDAKELFLARLAIGRSIGFKVGGKRVGRYSLKYSEAAVRELATCAHQVARGGGEAEVDPFI